MDHATRNATIRALAAATAAAIRMSPARALAAVSGEIDEPVRDARPLPLRCTDRDLPIERERNRYTGEHRDGGVR